MTALINALKQLQQRLRKPFPARPGVQQLGVPLSHARDDTLPWLASQPYFPQFYWQSRDGGEALAALGAARRFRSLPEAQQFLNQVNCPTLRICGLNAFDPQQGELFLPRLTWLRQHETDTLILTLYSEISLADEAARALTLLNNLRPVQALPPLPDACQQESVQPALPQWCQLVKRATDTIAAGALAKVVLARVTDLHFCQPVSPAALLAASRIYNPGCYHFMLAFNDRRAFLGSTPERLWQRCGSALYTEALAGTVASDDNPQQAQRLAQWLMQDQKNRRENALVVEDICQRMQPLVTGLQVQPPEVVRLRLVQHLRCLISGELAQPDDVGCLYQLQPTAAVAGLPREVARQFIARNEPFSRDWYAGSAGYLSLAHSEFCVTLRSAQLDNTQVRLYAGAGIVAGSDPLQEWQELERKAAGLRSLLLCH